jgi:integrase
MRIKLTKDFVESASAEPGKERTVFWDETLPGFGLVVTPNGSRSFCVQYRRADGVSKRLTLKSGLSLKDARKQAQVTIGSIAKGRDPLGERRKKAMAGKDTFKAIAEEYLKREGKRLRTEHQRRITLERLVYPKLGTRAITDIKRSDIVRLLDNIEDNNGATMADRTLATIRKIFNWHATRSDEFLSPIVLGMARTTSKESERERVLSPGELRAVWKSAESTPGPWGHLVKFLLLTATRRNEAARMVWSEVADDTWTIPASRYKTKNDVVLPLSKAARAVLAELPRIDKCPFVFSTDGTHPVAGFSKFKKRFDEVCGVTDWTLHDLRRTARSLMSRSSLPTSQSGASATSSPACAAHMTGTSFMPRCCMRSRRLLHRSSASSIRNRTSSRSGRHADEPRSHPRCGWSSASRTRPRAVAVRPCRHREPVSHQR